MARKKAETAEDLFEQEDALDPDAHVAEGSEEEEALTIDLDSIDESAASFQPLPRGVYDAFIEEMERKQSSNNNPMIAVRYRIVGGEYDKRLVFDHFVLNNDIGKARLKTFLQVLGFASGGNFNLAKFVDDAEGVGTRCRLKLSIRSQGGEKRQQVQEVMPSPDEDPFFG